MFYLVPFACLDVEVKQELLHFVLLLWLSTFDCQVQTGVSVFITDVGVEHALLLLQRDQLCQGGETVLLTRPEKRPKLITEYTETTGVNPPPPSSSCFNFHPIPLCPCTPYKKCCFMPSPVEPFTLGYQLPLIGPLCTVCTMQ